MRSLDDLRAVYSTYLSTYAKTNDLSLETDMSARIISREADKLRFLAAAEIRLRNDVESFRERIVRAVELRMALIRAFDRGGPISSSSVTMTEFYCGLDAFAAGKSDLGRDFYVAIGGRKKEERRHDSKFITTIGYAVKELVVDGKCSDDRLNDLRCQFSKPSLAGYGMLIEGISRRDISMSEGGIEGIIKGHKVLARAGGIFYSTPDEIVCFWALGLLNFAAYQGMKINVPESELLPKSLLVPVQK